MKGKLIFNESCNFLPISLLLRADFDRMDLDGDKGEDGNRSIDLIYRCLFVYLICLMG